ncbi:MAG: hypothetical protein IT559_04095 [Alphaproteobacteria bacterium]|nr:hypothetical protein [Alphaproteobacteria bacterium]
MQPLEKIFAKTLTNPAERKPVRADFPPVATHRGELLRHMIEELDKQGTSIKETQRINIFYPQKDPRNHSSPAGRIATDILLTSLGSGDFLQSKNASHIKWVKADALYEQHQLDRNNWHVNSLQSGFLTSLVRRQHYIADPALQSGEFPFLTANMTDTSPEYFILADHVYDRGRTFANMINYIEHNGGHVLAAYAPDNMRKRDLAQIQSQKGASHFKNYDHKSGRLPDLAAAFSASTNNAIEPEECIILLNEALAPHGLSLASLTNEECSDLQELASRKHLQAIIDEIHNAPVSPI